MSNTNQSFLYIYKTNILPLLFVIRVMSWAVHTSAASDMSPCMQFFWSHDTGGEMFQHYFDVRRCWCNLFPFAVGCCLHCWCFCSLMVLSWITNYLRNLNDWTTLFTSHIFLLRLEDLFDSFVLVVEPKLYFYSLSQETMILELVFEWSN